MNLKKMKSILLILIIFSNSACKDDSTTTEKISFEIKTDSVIKNYDSESVLDSLLQDIHNEKALQNNQQQIRVISEDQKTDADRISEYYQEEILKKNSTQLPRVQDQLSSDPMQRQIQLNNAESERFSPLSHLANQDNNIPDYKKAKKNPVNK